MTSGDIGRHPAAIFLPKVLGVLFYRFRERLPSSASQRSLRDRKLFSVRTRYLTTAPSCDTCSDVRISTPELASPPERASPIQGCFIFVQTNLLSARSLSGVSGQLELVPGCSLWSNPGPVVSPKFSTLPKPSPGNIRKATESFWKAVSSCGVKSRKLRKGNFFTCCLKGIPSDFYDRCRPLPSVADQHVSHYEVT